MSTRTLVEALRVNGIDPFVGVFDTVMVMTTRNVLVAGLCLKHDCRIEKVDFRYIEHDGEEVREYMYVIREAQ